MSWILTVVTFLPLLGALVCMVVPEEEAPLQRGVGLVFSLMTFLLSLGILAGFDAKLMNHEVNVTWTAPLGIHYHMGVDGISVWLVLLTTFLMPLVLLSAT